MNSSYNTGAISKMMTLNVLLVVIIVITVFILLTRDEQRHTPLAVSPTPSTAIPVKTPKPAEPKDNEEEIDALRKQLAQENSQLQALRTQEEKVAAIRRESAPEATKMAEQQTLKTKDAAPAPDQNETLDSAGKSAKTETPKKKSVE